MRLGLLADVHEALTPLRHALRLFEQAQVKEIVFLGDLCCMHKHLIETVRLLREAGVVGVWGNHDFGLCQEVNDRIRRDFDPEILAFTTTLQPRLVRDDCLFTHVEPWLDPMDITQLWYFEGLPDSPEKIARCFQAAPQRLLISGHNHCWFLATPSGPLAWHGERPIQLAPPERYMLILHALCRGHAAIYDTETGWLTPLRLDCDPE